MVSLTSVNTGFILRDVYQDLSAKLKHLNPLSIDCAFALWVYPEGRKLVQASLPADFAVTNYSHIGQLAFLIEIDLDNFNKYDEQLKDGLQRISGRTSTIAGIGPATFCTDAVALLGLALGAKRLGGEVLSTMRTWMSSFIDVTSTNIPDWKKILMHAALYFLNSDYHCQIQSYLSSIPDIQLALQSRGVGSLPSIDLDKVYQITCSGSIYGESEIPVIASRLQVLEYLSKHLPAISVSQPTVDQVTQLLQNLPNSFRRWVWEEKPKTSTGTQQKWDIQNEYHVQSLLSIVLTPIFPDLETEFYLESAGQLNPRADIGLPSLNLIIEVKFLRAKVSFSKMIEEIAADATLYFKKNGVFKAKYSKLLVFLWDDSNRDQEHGTFKNGVKGFNNIFDVVVVSRPGVLGQK